MMSSYHLAQGIRDAGIPLEAMIAHSCLQGSIEMLAEWEGLADYLLGSPFSIPDFAYDYASLLEDLSEGRTVEDALIRTAHRTMNLWQEFHDNQSNGTVVEVSHLKELTPLWDVFTRDHYPHAIYLAGKEYPFHRLAGRVGRDLQEGLSKSLQGYVST